MLGPLYLQGYYYLEEVLPQNPAVHPDVGPPASELGTPVSVVEAQAMVFHDGSPRC